MNSDIYEDDDFEIKIPKNKRQRKPVSKRIPKKKIVIEEPVEEPEIVEDVPEPIKSKQKPKPKQRRTSRKPKIVDPEPIENETDNTMDSSDEEDIEELPKKTRGRPVGSRNKSQPIIIKIDNSKKYKNKKKDRVKYKGEFLDKKTTLTHETDVDEDDQKIAQYISELMGLKLEDDE